MPPKTDHKMSAQAPGTMMAEAIAEPWLQVPIGMLGAWLIASPATLSYGGAMAWSDAITGLVIMGLAVATFVRHQARYALANCIVGLWLLFAPLLFWAPAAAYANDTLVGAAVIAFTLLLPMRMKMTGPDVPPGWSYNPSTWQQRLPMIGLALISFLIARYMAAYQLGHTDAVWEPFFRPGTEAILTSEISKAWPVSDAGLGALVYLIEVLSGAMGDERRWRTMPWMVAIFGLAVIPLGVASIVLVILQPVGVGTWCTLCLATALFMLIMIPLALDEVVAMGQFLAREVRAGRSFWHAFFLGGHVEGEVQVHRPSDVWRPRAMFWGLSVPWTLLASATLGLWLLFAPDVLGNQAGVADSDHLSGALIITWALIAWAEVGRSVRFLNIPLGLWLLAAPWVLAGASTPGRWSDMAIGLLLILLSLPRGRVLERYGGWDRWIR